jgi:hypothetical protein
MRRSGSWARRDSGEVVPFDRLRGGDQDALGLLGLVAAARGVPILLLLHPSRCVAAVAEARQLAMYLVHVALRRDYAAVGRYFGRDRTTVAHACARIEDGRDEPSFDDFVAQLEARLEVGRQEELRRAG